MGNAVEKGQIFQLFVLEHLDHVHKMILYPHISASYYTKKMNSNCIVDLNTQSETTKLLGENLPDPVLCDNFLGVTQKSKFRIQQLHELDFMKIYNFSKT